MLSATDKSLWELNRLYKFLTEPSVILRNLALQLSQCVLMGYIGSCTCVCLDTSTASMSAYCTVTDVKPSMIDVVLKSVISFSTHLRVRASSLAEFFFFLLAGKNAAPPDRTCACVCLCACVSGNTAALIAIHFLLLQLKFLT